MEQLTSGLSGKTYRVGAALAGLGEGFYRGFDGAREVTLRIAAANTPAVATLPRLGERVRQQRQGSRLALDLAHEQVDQTGLQTQPGGH